MNHCTLFLYFYRPQRSWGKVIFSEACVKNSVNGGGVLVSQHGLQVFRPTPGGRLRGLAGGVSRPTPSGEAEGSGQGDLQVHTRGGS